MLSQRSYDKPEAEDWLGDCIGYVVESDAGRIGRIQEIHRDPESGRPVELLVRAGMAGRRHFLIPLDAVVAVITSGRLVVLDPLWVPKARPLDDDPS